MPTNEARSGIGIIEVQGWRSGMQRSETNVVVCRTKEARAAKGRSDQSSFMSGGRAARSGAERDPGAERRSQSAAALADEATNTTTSEQGVFGRVCRGDDGEGTFWVTAEEEKQTLCRLHSGLWERNGMEQRRLERRIPDRETWRTLITE